MRVVTFTEKDVDAAAKQLVDAIIADGIYPDAVVGIKTGGVDVARGIIKWLNRQGGNPVFIEAFIQRKSTPWKKKLLSGILPLFPTCFLDWLRIREAMLLRRSSDAGDGNKNFSFDIGLFDSLGDNCRVLVVDDAVDSGTTLISVVNALKAERRISGITTAVVTVTTLSPRIMPDYFVFNDETLVRFPWSTDVKKK